MVAYVYMVCYGSTLMKLANGIVKVNLYEASQGR